MNELLIIGGLLGLLTIVCALVEAVERRREILAWLDMVLTVHYASRAAQRRVRAIWKAQARNVCAASTEWTPEFPRQSENPVCELKLSRSPSAADTERERGRVYRAGRN